MKTEIQEAEYNLKLAEIREKERNSQRLIIDKLAVLDRICNNNIIDKDKPFFGGEQCYKPLFTDAEQQVIKDKILSLIKSL